MSKKVLHIFFFLFFIAPLSTEAATAPEAWAESAEAAYDSGNYKAALEHYQKIATDLHSPSLYYNIGNAALRAGELGTAILYYRKAEKRAPWDSDLGHNLSIALERTRDDFNTKRGKNGILSGIKNFVVESPFGEWWTLAFASSILSGAIVLSIALRRKNSQNTEWGIMILFLLLSGSFFGADRWRKSILETNKGAVICSPSVKVKNEPTDQAKTAFILHEGTTVNIREQEKKWTEIRTPDDQVGWIPNAKAAAF